jgi:hypothetical protein
MASAPPPIEVELGDGRRERLGIVASHVLAGASFGGWLPSSLMDLATSPAGAAMAVVIASLVGGLIGAAAGARAWTPPTGRLRWNGRGWSLAAQAGEVDVRIDAGPWMLLRFRSAARRPVWFTLDARTHGNAWHGLRIALLHAKSGATANDGPPDGPGVRAP